MPVHQTSTRCHCTTVTTPLQSVLPDAKCVRSACRDVNCWASAPLQCGAEFLQVESHPQEATVGRFQHIIVPIDFGEPAQEALQLAIDLARSTCRHHGYQPSWHGRLHGAGAAARQSGHGGHSVHRADGVRLRTRPTTRPTPSVRQLTLHVDRRTCPTRRRVRRSRTSTRAGRAGGGSPGDDRTRRRGSPSRRAARRIADMAAR